MLLFSFGFLDDKENEECIKAYDLEDFKERILKLKYILYPSFIQVDYNVIIYFMQAPILNFRLTNSRKYIHDMFETPLFEVYHDVKFHGDVTHGFQFENTNKTYTKKINTAARMGFSPADRKIHDKQVFENANAVITKLKPFLKYTRPKLSSNKEFSEEIYKRNFVFSYVLFYLLHEKGKFSQLKDMETLLDVLNNYKIKGNFSDSIYLEKLNTYEQNAIRSVLKLDSQTEITLDHINQLLVYVLDTLSTEFNIKIQSPESNSESSESGFESGSNKSNNSYNPYQYQSGYRSNGGSRYSKKSKKNSKLRKSQKYNSKKSKKYKS